MQSCRLPRAQACTVLDVARRPQRYVHVMLHSTGLHESVLFSIPILSHSRAAIHSHISILNTTHFHSHFIKFSTEIPVSSHKYSRATHSYIQTTALTDHTYHSQIWSPQQSSLHSLRPHNNTADVQVCCNSFLLSIPSHSHLAMPVPKLHHVNFYSHGIPMEKYRIRDLYLIAMTVSQLQVECAPPCHATASDIH